MQLKSFDKTTEEQIHSVDTIINFRRNGPITVGKLMAKALNLPSENPAISLHQNVAEPKDWYVCEDRINGHALRLKESGCYTFNSKHITNAIFESLDIPTSCPAVSFNIAINPLPMSDVGILHAILTSKPILSKAKK